MFPNIEVELQLPKEKTVLERITDMVNVRDLTFIHDPTTVDGILTAIQYLIKMNKVDLLRRINDLSSVSFSGQTVRGETCIQLAMETGNCQMVEFILSANYEKQIRILHNQIDSLKMTQVSLYEDKRKSTDHIKLLKEECDSTRLNRILNKMKTYFIIFLIILMFIF